MIRQLLALFTSALTLWGMWLAGSRSWKGWLVGLLNQATWLGFIIAFGAWGLLPLNAALVVTYSRNLRKWRRESVVQISRTVLVDENWAYGSNPGMRGVRY